MAVLKNILALAVVTKRWMKNHQGHLIYVNYAGGKMIQFNSQIQIITVVLMGRA